MTGAVVISGNRVKLCQTASSHSPNRWCATTTCTWHCSSALTCEKYIWWFYFLYFFTEFSQKWALCHYWTLFLCKSASSRNFKGADKTNHVIGQQRRILSKELSLFFLCCLPCWSISAELAVKLHLQTGYWVRKSVFITELFYCQFYTSMKHWENSALEYKAINHETT